MSFQIISAMKISLFFIILIYSIISIIISISFDIIPLSDTIFINFVVGFLRYIWILILFVTVWYSYFYRKALGDLVSFFPPKLIGKIGNVDELLLKVAILFSSSAIIMDTFYRLYRNNSNEHFIKIMLWEIIFITFLITIYAMRKTISRYDHAIIIYMLFIIVWSLWTQERLSFGKFIRHYGFIALSIGLVAGKGRFPVAIARSVFLIVAGTFSFYYFIYGTDVVATGNLLGYNRNSVSMITITLALFVYLNDFINGAIRPVIWPSVLSLYIATLSLGRGGTVIALLLFIFVIIYNILHYYKIVGGNNNFSNIVKRFFFASGLLIVVVALFFLADMVLSYSRFSTEGIVNRTTIQRIIIWESFLDEMTVKRALLGFHFECPIAGLKGLDPHFGFFHLWSQVGIFAFPVFGFLGFLLYKYFKISLFLAGLFLLYLMFYVVGHRMLHHGMFEIIISTLAFYYFYKTRNSD